MSEQLLLDAASSFFNDFSQTATPATLLLHFSTTQPIAIQHAPALSQNGHNSPLLGPNAVRSYFDLLATHWTRAPVAVNHTEADLVTNTVTADASITWTWRRSRRRWREDFICVLTYDDSLKITSLNLQTVSDPETCLMNAVDMHTTTVEYSNERVNKSGRWDWSRHV